VNRNVTCTANPSESPLHQQTYELAGKISEMCLPKPNPIMISGLMMNYCRPESRRRSFVSGQIPSSKTENRHCCSPNNDVDVFINDIALIAIIENNEIAGYNIAAGGGLGATHGNEATYARLASVLGFVDTEEKV
jgi:sulfite reductase (NADPH) hemoprotein beta-component